MPTYISLCRWTQQGAQSAKESPTRLDAAKSAFAKNGAKLLSFYMVMGSHDFVVIAETPSDEVMAKTMLGLMSKGSFTSQTSRAFTEDEYRKVMQSI